MLTVVTKVSFRDSQQSEGPSSHLYAARGIEPPFEASLEGLRKWYLDIPSTAPPSMKRPLLLQVSTSTSS